MNEYEIMIKNLENRVTELEKQLFAGAVKTVEPVKWQPKGGNFQIDCGGDVVSVNSFSHQKEFGTKRTTQEQAQRAAVEMRRFNRLLALRDDLCEGDTVDWSSNTPKYGIYFYHKDKIWEVSPLKNLSCDDIKPYFTTKELAQKACDMLNSGEVEL